MFQSREAVVPGFIDFAAVKAANPIKDVAEKLGLELKKAGNALRGPCPSGDGGERGLVITPHKELWYSFPLQKGGDVLALVQLVNKCSAKEAAEFLSITEPLGKTEGSSPEEGREARGGFAPLEYLEHDHPAVEAIGFDPEDAKALGIGYAPRGLLRGMVAIPVSRRNGTLAGYLGITEAKLPTDWK